MAAPGAAADVLRSLLTCPVHVLLSQGEEALKAVLPKVGTVPVRAYAPIGLDWIYPATGGELGFESFSAMGSDAAWFDSTC